jgi:hypothetical protein
MGVLGWLRNKNPIRWSFGFDEMMASNIGHNLSPREDLKVELLLQLMKRL